MTWAKLDDRANEHRKQLAAGAEACWLWACGLMYANRQRERDGFIPEVALGMLFPLKNPRRLAERLVEVGLWERAPGGFLIHDFLFWNQSKEEREAELAAGRERAAKSYAARKAKNQSSSPEETPKLREVFTDSSGSTPTPTPLPTPTPKDPKGSSEGEPGKPARARKAPQVPVSAWDGPNAEHRLKALNLGLNVDRCADAMRNWAASKDDRKASWDHAFHGWLDRESERNPRAANGARLSDPMEELRRKAQGLA